MKKLLTFGIILIFSTIVNSQTLIQVVNLPNNTFFNSGYGLVYANGKYWISSGSSSVGKGIWYGLNANGNISDTVTVKNYPALSYSQGLAFDGTNFWYVERKTARCDLFKISPDGSVLDSIPIASAGGTTSWYLGGAAWDGTGLWVSLYSPDASVAIYKINTTTKTIVDTIVSQQLQPTGVTVKGDTLFYVNDGFQGSDKIYAYKISSKEFLYSFDPPETPGQRQNPRGLAWDGSHFWLMAEPVGASSGRQLFKYDLGGSGTPQISVPTKFFDFGDVQIGTSGQITASIQNIGTASLQIDSVQLVYSNRFTTNITTPTSIPASGSLSFNVNFTPLVYGNDSAHVMIYHSDFARGPQTIRVVGRGVFSNAIISVPASNNFGTKRVNSTNLWYLKIQNLGSQTLTVSSATFATSNFYVDPGTFPISVSPVSSKYIKVWFKPISATTFNDSIIFTSNASNASEGKTLLSGSGNAAATQLGETFWLKTIPDHPNSNTSRNVKGVRAIGDISGDGKPDIIVCTENYWTVALNGNSSGDNDTLWSFNTYISNYSAGSIGTAGDYSYQKALAIASDLNNDGFNDVVIGTGGGNETVYAINGKTGAMLWKFGTDHPDSFSLGDMTGVDAAMDFNNDGVPDIIAASSATQTGGIGGRRSVYLFNGVNGNIIWQREIGGFTHGVTSIADLNNDNIPDVIASVGEPAYKFVAYSGANGSTIWDYPLGTASGKEVLVFPKPAGQKPDVILGAFWGPIYRVNGQTGATVWTFSTGGSAPTQMKILKDVTGDGVPEIIVSLLGGGVWCINGATGVYVWTQSTGNTMGITDAPDLNGDGIDEVAAAVQNQGTYIYKGSNGEQMAFYTFGGSTQTREVAAVPDIDGNGSFEIIAGSNLGNVVLISGGTSAVVSPSVTVNSPNGGETWYVGQSKNITWTSQVITNVKIELTTNNGTIWSTIIASTPASNGSYAWTVTNTPSAQCKVRISDASNAATNDESNSTFTISSQLCKDLNVAAGWNMIAIPLNASNMTKTGLFPTATSPAYGYSNGYITSDTLTPSKGYWLKFASPELITICGTPVGSTTVPVVLGWNLIGVYDTDVPVSGVTSTPSGIIASQFYGYSAGYFTPTTLNFGKGYWIKVSQSGTLNLPTLTSKNAEFEMRSAELEKFSKLIVKDSDGNETTLYLTKDEICGSRYELPPIPPSGVFDARFSSDRLVENIINGSKELSISTLAYPVKIKVEGTQIRVKDIVSGKIIDAMLNDGEEVIIENNKLNKFSIESIELPAKFELMQNYPNPFNPSTTIRFALPIESKVTLSIYNILGEKVVELINQQIEAGYHQVKFNAHNLASGTYIYGIQIGDFINSKKMLIVK
ncbi:MAG: choice-of-anchor D domain-containing protein [Ignavibacteria bacterium]|nr:choice-of-anchor D domain-containing protein [Ignavibacteria bacterium]